MKNLLLMIFFLISLPVFADINFTLNTTVPELKKPNTSTNICGMEFILFSEDANSTFSPFYKNQILYLHINGKNYEIYTNEDMRNYSIALEDIQCDKISNGYIIILNLGSNSPRGGGLGYKVIKYFSITNDMFLLFNIANIHFDVFTESVFPMMVFNNQQNNYLIIKKRLENSQDSYYGYKIVTTNSEVQIINTIITSVIDDNVRVRSLDNTTSKILTSLNRGDLVQIIKYGKNEVINDGSFIWTYIYIPRLDLSGWIYGEYLYSRPGEK